MLLSGVPTLIPHADSAENKYRLVLVRQIRACIA